MHCDFVNVYIRHEKVWVPDAPADPSGDPPDPTGPGHFEWQINFKGGEMKFNDPDAVEKWKQVGSVSRDTGTFTFDKDVTVETMVTTLIAAMETAAGVTP
jgi:hypothetical protein